MFRRIINTIYLKFKIKDFQNNKIKKLLKTLNEKPLEFEGFKVTKNLV